MTSDQLFSLIYRIKDVCYELKENRKAVDRQTEAIKENTELQKKIYDIIKK